MVVIYARALLCSGAGRRVHSGCKVGVSLIAHSRARRTSSRAYFTLICAALRAHARMLQCVDRPLASACMICCCVQSLKQPATADLHRNQIQISILCRHFVAGVHLPQSSDKVPLEKLHARRPAAGLPEAAV